MLLTELSSQYLTTNNRIGNRLFRVSPIYYEAISGANFSERELGMLSFNAPPRCNYRCRKCLSGIDDTNKMEGQMLSDDETAIIIEEAVRLGALCIEISGTGEPLVTKDWVLEIVDRANRHGIDSLIVTNGSLLTEDIARFLAERNCAIMVSLDCMNAETYDDAVGRRGYFERVLDNIRVAANIFAPLIREEDGMRIMRFGIHAIVSDFNLEQMVRLRAFADEHKMYFSMAPVATTVGNASRNIVFLRNTRPVEIQNSINLLSDASIIVCQGSAHQYGFPVCGSMRYGLGVDYNGDVLIDAHFYETRGIIGNIRDIGLEEAIRRRTRYVNMFYQLTGSRSFCPLRDGQNYRRFLANLRTNQERCSE